jgi:hypothetical protein
MELHYSTTFGYCSEYSGATTEPGSCFLTGPKDEKKSVEEEKDLVATEEEKEEKKSEILSEEDILPFAPELLEGAPPELRRAIQMSSSMMRMVGPAPSPLMSAIGKVLTSEHLTTVIESAKRSEELGYSNAQRVRWTNLLYLIVVLIFAGFALWILKDSNPDLLERLVTELARHGKHEETKEPYKRTRLFSIDLQQKLRMCMSWAFVFDFLPNHTILNTGGDSRAQNTRHKCPQVSWLNRRIEELK